MDSTILAKSLVACAVAVVGSTLHGTVGIGFGLFVAPILALIDPLFVPGPILLSGLVLVVLMAYRERQAIDSSGMTLALVGRVVGVLAAIAVLAILPKREMTVFFGVLVLLAVLLSVSDLHIRPTTWAIISIGMLSGLMSTTSAIGGPPMALLYQNSPGARLRSTLSGYLIFGTIISLLSLAFIGRFSYDELRLSFVLLPGVLIGFLFSTRALVFLDQKHTRAAVLVISAVSGLVVILRALL